MNFIICLAILGFSCASAHIIPKTESRFDAEKDVFFHLYTQDNPSQSQVVTNGDEQSLLTSNYRQGKPVKVLIHGMGGSVNSEMEQKLKEAFLQVSDVNVFIVDWNIGATGQESQMVDNVAFTGKFVASFVDWLSQYGLNYDDLHLVGGSIGSHVVGFAGRNTQKGKIAYLTACDPPRRNWQNSTDKINPADGRYVEIIHSSTLVHSLEQPTGHVDFYPNGGAEMPGCEGNDLCSHARANEYLIYSIDNQYFLANECASYEEIQNGLCSNLSQLHLGGIKPKFGRTGVFYLETEAQPPYYKQ